MVSWGSIICRVLPWLLGPSAQGQGPPQLLEAAPHCSLSCPIPRPPAAPPTTLLGGRRGQTASPSCWSPALEWPLDLAAGMWELGPGTCWRKPRWEAGRTGWAHCLRWGSARPTDAFLLLPTLQARKGDCLRHSSDEEQILQTNPAAVPVPASDRADCAAWWLSPRQRVRLFRLRGECDL